MAGAILRGMLAAGVSPDEVVLDQCYLNFASVLDSNWSLRLGRQDFMLGNGMVMLENSPADEARTVYFDGLAATYQTEVDTLKLFAFYSDYKDTSCFINDQNRALRWGDTLTVGFDETRQLKEDLGIEVYYLHIDVDDDAPGRFPIGINTPVDSNAEMDVVGARIFGSPHDQMDYSLEYAQQFGTFDQNGQNAGGLPNDSGDFSGRMVDARMNLRAADGTALSPVLMLQYTYLSGDDMAAAGGTENEYEGWRGIFSAYPIWREELLPLSILGAWSNMNQYRTACEFTLAENVKLTGAWAVLVADAGENGTGGGDNMGHLVTGFLDIGVQENLSVALEGSVFYPGNYYEDGQVCEWLRVGALYTF